MQKTKKNIKEIIAGLIISILAVLTWLSFSGYGERIYSGLKTFSAGNPEYVKFRIGNRETVKINLQVDKKLDYLFVLKAEFIDDNLFKKKGGQDFNNEADYRQRAFIGLIPEDAKYKYSFNLKVYKNNNLLLEKKYHEKSESVAIGGAKPENKNNLARIRVFDLFQLDQGIYRFEIEDLSDKDDYYQKIITSFGVYPDRRIRK